MLKKEAFLLRDELHLHSVPLQQLCQALGHQQGARLHPQSTAGVPALPPLAWQTLPEHQLTLTQQTAPPRQSANKPLREPTQSCQPPAHWQSVPQQRVKTRPRDWLRWICHRPVSTHSLYVGEFDLNNKGVRKRKTKRGWNSPFGIISLHESFSLLKPEEDKYIKSPCHNTEALA